MLQQNKIFDACGFPITFFEIISFYRYLDTKSRADFGDPLQSDDACQAIAFEIGRQKIMDIQSEPVNLQIRGDINDIDWGNPNVLTNIMAAVNRGPQKRQSGSQYSGKPGSWGSPEPLLDWKSILEIPSGSEITEKSLKVFFRKAARKYHPDVQGGDETKMKQIIEARDVAYKAMGLV